MHLLHSSIQVCPFSFILFEKHTCLKEKEKKAGTKRRLITFDGDLKRLLCLPRTRDEPAPCIWLLDPKAWLTAEIIPPEFPNKEQVKRYVSVCWHEQHCREREHKPLDHALILQRFNELWDVVHATHLLLFCTNESLLWTKIDGCEGARL